jgi:uncharacterized RDD family membrane protein YckC
MICRKYYIRMMEKTPYVGPFLRIIASVYDFFLVFGVLMFVGSIALLLKNLGIAIYATEALNPALGLMLVIISGWVFFAIFWMKGGQTLGMQVWGFKIVNTDQNHDHITLKQTLLRYAANLGILLLLGMPLFLIYADSKKLAVNDIFSKTKLIKLKS